MATARRASRSKSGRKGGVDRTASTRPGKITKGTRRRRSVWRWVKRLAIAVVALAVLGLASGAGAIAYFSRDLPDVSALRDYHPPQTTRVVDRNGELLGESFEERRTVVPLARVPRHLVLSVLAAEDADFYQHRGLDYSGLLRAIGRGLLSGGRFRGTSTITQQVIKNLVLSPERSYTRKIRELLLARRLEQELTKDEILELYLNYVNFGHGRYGVQEASRYYFDIDVEDLSLAQATLIAGIPQSPTHLSPRTHPDAARRRQQFVLDQLGAKRAEYWPDLSDDALAAARAETVEIVPAVTRDRPAPEVTTMARRLLRDLVGEEAAARGGYRIETTLDVRLQRLARESLREGLEAVDQRQRNRGPLRVPRRSSPIEPLPALRIGGTYDAVVVGADDDSGLIRLQVAGHPATARLADAARYNPDELPPSEFAADRARLRVSILQLPSPDDPESSARARLELGPEGAAVVIDPRTRDVLALVGGYELGPGFDRARSAVRQPGSTFKPLVYAVGLRSRRFTPATIVLDAPGVYDDWRPSNYETWSFEGHLRLRQALARSINQVAVRVIEEVSPDAVVSFARDLGITTELDPQLSLALGASDVRVIELVNAYATFPAGGRWAPARIVRRIVGPDGEEVPLPAAEAPRDVLSSAEAYLVSSMLTSVVREGTARSARQLRIPVAGKTGTSNDVRDAWFVGFTPEVVAGVWVGYDDRRPLGRRESGGRTALPIWMRVIAGAAEGRRAAFRAPSGVVTERIDPATGLLPYEGQEDAIEEVFLEGTVPTEVAPDPTLADEGTFAMEQLGFGPEPDDDEASAP